ncbi:MAG: type II toxin-antitoxin system HicB family antitoxin [Anaerolineae bacterium]|nr:type II toxin-antitoxin system HicB family antitoxin [Anaerolineae bacterium]MCB9130667.1 type II toxin-antitoxin system HicB family antitoxin [Anaerolineales bacterium]MCB9142337.1 type II toxin-antitoxin system HicB family antitoxin [Anaerolineales bacterium]MCO5244835.1 type II toxin-antitoxin system HicB family antitoxin [Anaerolineae bacterium]HRX04737.1 type II toxin-antitoxin system HicB family antitoxin [Anaerolineae bacterium]
MLASYLDAALEHAHYEIIEDEDAYWGEITGLQGVWARHATLEGCRRELREALSDWVAVRLRLNLDIPPMAGIDLSLISQVMPA